MTLVKALLILCLVSTLQTTTSSKELKNSTKDCILYEKDSSTFYSENDCLIICDEQKSLNSHKNCSLATKNIEDSKTFFKIPKNLQNEIQRIVVEGEAVAFLPQSIHEFFPNLLEISVDTTSIKILSNECFEKLRNLTNLKLINGELTDICGTAFHDLQSLKEIDLSVNEIKFLHPNLFKNNLQLQKINLSSNLLEILHPLLFSWLLQLSILDLNFNAITFIDKRQFIENQQLRELFLIGNNIKAIEFGAFNGLLELKVLHINDNPCTADYEPEFQEEDINVNSTIKFINEECSKVDKNQHEIEVKINAYNKWFGRKYVTDKCGSDDKIDYSSFYLESSSSTKLLGCQIWVYVGLVSSLYVNSLKF